MGQVPELFLPRPETFPERAAQAEGVEHLDRLEPERLGIRPRIEEREQSLVAVRLGDRQREDADRGQTPTSFLFGPSFLIFLSAVLPMKSCFLSRSTSHPSP